MINFKRLLGELDTTSDLDAKRYLPDRDNKPSIYEEKGDFIDPSWIRSHQYQGYRYLRSGNLVEASNAFKEMLDCAVTENSPTKTARAKLGLAQVFMARRGVIIQSESCSPQVKKSLSDTLLGMAKKLLLEAKEKGETSSSSKANWGWTKAEIHELLDEIEKQQKTGEFTMSYKPLMGSGFDNHIANTSLKPPFGETSVLEYTNRFGSSTRR